MKKSVIKTFGAGLMLSAALTIGAVAQGVSGVSVSETTTSTTTSSGTVSEFLPDTVVIRSETSTTPMRYSYSKTTTVVDEAGNPVDVSIVKTGIPVQVIYAKEGDRMVARKIIVRKKVTTTGDGAGMGTAVERRESTTTTTEEK